MPGVISFELTQDFMKHPDQYPNLINKDFEQKCQICLNNILIGEQIAANQECYHYFHAKELTIWIELAPKETESYGEVTTLAPTCPICKSIIDPQNITELTKEEVLKMRKDSIEDESLTNDLANDTPKDPEMKSLIATSTNSTYSKESLIRVVKIATAIVITTAIIFINYKALQQ